MKNPNIQRVSMRCQSIHTMICLAMDILQLYLPRPVDEIENRVDRLGIGRQFPHQIDHGQLNPLLVLNQLQEQSFYDLVSMLLNMIGETFQPHTT